MPNSGLGNPTDWKHRQENQTRPVNAWFKRTSNAGLLPQSITLAN